ncbi:MAG: hypothetical protein KDH09_17160 [Chrysiogenetes bacterium]|nr:hypothetical protein [Chrysiogenetes bacterium]
MQESLKKRALLGLIAAFALLGVAAPAHADEVEFKEFRLVDASSFWVLHENKWERLKLAWVDGPDQNANRPLSHRLELPMNYAELRIEWVRWLRQVETFREPSLAALRKILEKSDDRTWEELPEAGPRRHSSARRGTFWAQVEVDGDDVGEELIKQGWAIPLLPAGVAEPDNWRDLQEELQKSMDGCRGMWRTVLQQCYLASENKTGGK